MARSEKIALLSFVAAFLISGCQHTYSPYSQNGFSSQLGSAPMATQPVVVPAKTNQELRAEVERDSPNLYGVFYRFVKAREPDCTKRVARTKGSDVVKCIKEEWDKYSRTPVGASVIDQATLLDRQEQFRRQDELQRVQAEAGLRNLLEQQKREQANRNLQVMSLEMQASGYRPNDPDWWAAISQLDALKASQSNGVGMECETIRLGNMLSTQCK